MDNEYDKLIRRMNPPRYSSSFLWASQNETGFDFRLGWCFKFFASVTTGNLLSFRFSPPSFLVLLTSWSNVNNQKQMWFGFYCNPFTRVEVNELNDVLVLWLFVSRIILLSVLLHNTISSLLFFFSFILFIPSLPCRVVIDNNACKDATVIQVLSLGF